MAKKKEILYDFGEWNIPEKWEDVTLEKFTKLMSKTENGVNDVRDVIAIMADRTMEDVNLLPVDFVESLMARLTFLNKSPEYENKNEIIIDDEVYHINVLEKLKFGEYVDVNSAIQGDNLNYAAFLGILCRKEGEEYDDDFIANKLDERIEMFNKQPINKILPVIGFFLALFATSETYSQAFMTEVKQTTSQLLQETENLWRDGGYKKLSLTSRMKIWWKLRKLKKQASQLL